MDKNDEVSDEQLMSDIEFTRKEAKAYENISNGFYDLMYLPENAGKSEYSFQYKKYADLQDCCNKFLDFLKHLADTRGLL